MRPAPIRWPNDAKIAVSFFVAFEAFEKYSQYRQGGDKPDYASLAYGEYGGKAGIWRIMDVLNRNGVKGTIDTNGRIAEDFPDALKELHAGGHEIVGHGWVNDTALSSLDADAERKLIRRTLDALGSVTGKRPVGWVSPGHRINEYTFGKFVDEGIFWTGDLPGPDIPQHRIVNGKPMVIMPRLDYANDLEPSVHAQKSRARFISTASRPPSIVSTPKAKPARPSSSIVSSTPISAADPTSSACLKNASATPKVFPMFGSPPKAKSPNTISTLRQ